MYTEILCYSLKFVCWTGKVYLVTNITIEQCSSINRCIASDKIKTSYRLYLEKSLFQCAENYLCYYLLCAIMQLSTSQELGSYCWWNITFQLLSTELKLKFSSIAVNSVTPLQTQVVMWWATSISRYLNTHTISFFSIIHTSWVSGCILNSFWLWELCFVEQGKLSQPKILMNLH